MGKNARQLNNNAQFDREPRKTFVAPAGARVVPGRRRNARESQLYLRATEEQVALDGVELDAFLSLIRAQNPLEAQREAARLRSLLGGDAQALEEHIHALVTRVADLQHLKLLAATDPLTGVANLRAFHDGLRRELSRSRRSGKPLAVLMYDIDGFKAINDTYGHAAGDHALRALARCAHDLTRQLDLVARIGGDELAILLPETDARSANAIGERIRDELALGTRERLPLSLSMGVAVTYGGELSGHSLLAEADRRLYRDKAERRARGVPAGARARSASG